MGINESHGKYLLSFPRRRESSGFGQKGIVILLDPRLRGDDGERAGNAGIIYG
jgi:hypothetical protein